MSDNATPPVFVIFACEVTPQTVAALTQEAVALATAGVQEVHLLISSPGGHVMPGMALYGLLRSMPFHLTTHNIGNVDSIANIIFLAGATRYSVPHGTFMFHGVALNTTGPLKMDERFLRANLDSVSADHTKMATIIKDRAKFDRIEDIMGLFTDQATKDANFAASFGLIHEARDAKIPSGARIIQIRA